MDNEAMQDSGIEWIGAIPQTWKVSKLRYEISIKNGDFISNKLDGESEYPVVGGNGFMGRTDSYNVNGDIIVIGRVGAYCGNVHHINEKSWVSDNALIVDTGNNKRFFTYLLNAFNLNSIANKTAQPVVTATNIKAVYIPIPPLLEQQQIVDYLKWRCSKLDAIIAIKQQQIKTLDALRQSVIYQAVTKGLDASAPLVDSGVEWLGRIPQGWKLIRLKNIANIRYGLGQPPATKDDGIPIIRATDIKAGTISAKNFLLIDPETLPLSRNPYLKAGEIIVVRSGAYTGDSAIIPAKHGGAVAGYDLVVTVKNADSKFISYCLLSSYVLNAQLLLLTLRAAQPHLNAQELGGILLVLPETLEEQQYIANHLDQETQRLNDLKVNLNQQISTLEAYKKSLIYECVTGKKESKRMLKSCRLG